MSKDRLYKVKKIVGFKRMGGMAHYKVHWEGYSRDHDTWEPITNLTECGSFIEEYHSHVSVAGSPRKRKSGARLTLASATPGDQEKEAPVLRRSQRARTPTRLFSSEVVTPSPPQKSSRGGTTKKRAAGTQRKTTHRQDDEEDTDEEEGLDFHRSEYELRSRGALRRSPRRLPEVHYFNTELPQARKLHAGKDEDATPATGNSVTSTLLPPSKTLLSSDEEGGSRVGGNVGNSRGGRGGGGSRVGGGGTGNAVTPAIAECETRMRQRLTDLSSLTRKKVTEALNTLTTLQKENDTLASQPQSSQPSTTSAVQTHSYKTRSQTAQSQPSGSITSKTTFTAKTTSMTERRKLHKPTQPLPPPPPAAAAPATSQDEERAPSSTVDNTDDSSESYIEEFPNWMKFGWEEATFILIIIGLLLFAYYCFNSDSC